MKVDHHGCLVREKYIDGHPGNLGDSCAETCRALIFLNFSNPRNLQYWKFVSWRKRTFLRHPDLETMPGWGAADFSNDQYLPLLLVFSKMVLDGTKSIMPGLFIPGTRTIISPGVWAASRGHYWLLNAFNIVQGWLFNLNWRWSDDERMKGKFWKFERSEGKTQDWISYASTYIYLRNNGHWATLNQPVKRVLEAIEIYYLNGPDYEPNSQWIYDFYEKALGVQR